MKNMLLLSLTVVLILILAACNAAGEAEPVENAPDSGEVTAVPEEVETDAGEATAVPEDVETDAAEVTAAGCPEATPGTHQLIYAAGGFCFLYPDNYGVFQGNDGSLALYVRSLLNTEAPMATIRFEEMGDRSIQEIIPDYPSDADLAAMSFLAIELGEETATVLDNLPGQDVNRRIITVHDGRVYDLMIARIGPEYGEVGEQAEALYNLITGSFQFIGLEPDAPLLAGPECPEPTSGTFLFTNAEDGFCLLLPDGYSVDDSLTTEEGGTETAVYVDSLQDVSHARLFITIEDAGGRSLEDIMAGIEADIESALPGYDAIWSFGYMLDGVWANQFEQMPGQDLSRQLVLVREDRLYKLTFIPDDQAAGESYTEMQALYEIVLDSFSFLR